VEETLDDEVEGGGGEEPALRHAADGLDDSGTGRRTGLRRKLRRGRMSASQQRWRRVASMASFRSESKAVGATPARRGGVSRSHSAAQSWSPVEG
jgi:hypothetical protein